jgi:PPOX class probable F420-dependent enzyme
MTTPIPEAFLDLFRKPAFASLATLLPDGSPVVTPVWVDYDGTYVTVNAHRCVLKTRNILADPRVALTIYDPQDPYRFLSIRGRVVESTREGAAVNHENLLQRYLGKVFRWVNDDLVLHKIEVQHATGSTY